MHYQHLKYCLYVFFFQAEDGIRDVAVTGVQTCALPILGELDHVEHAEEQREADGHHGVDHAKHEAVGDVLPEEAYVHRLKGSTSAYGDRRRTRCLPRPPICRPAPRTS